jgi:hypothetical protein
MVSTAGVLYPYTAMSALFSMLNDERFTPQLPPISPGRQNNISTRLSVIFSDIEDETESDSNEKRL